MFFCKIGILEIRANWLFSNKGISKFKSDSLGPRLGVSILKFLLIPWPDWNVQLRQICQTEDFTIELNSSIWISWKPRFWHLIFNFAKFMKILWHFFIQIFAKISKIEIQNSKITICSIQEAPKLHLSRSDEINWIYSDERRGR